MASEKAKKLIGNIYSYTADKLYEPIVVKRAFPLFGGDLNDVVLEQGRRAVASAAGRPILDMPVGTAYFTVEIARTHPGLVIGVDIARGMVEQAMRVAGDKGLENLVTTQADAHDMPFKDGVFGAILCTNGLQVIPGLAPTIAELARVLAPGCSIYCSVITMPLANFLGRSTRKQLPTLFRPGMDVAEEMSEADLYVTSMSQQRFATLIEAVKPAL